MRRVLVYGTILGLVILGIGGRLVMASIAVQAGGSAQFTLGGTMTVVMLGAASGLGGALMAIVSRFVAERLLPQANWVQYPMLSALLLLVTMRGLRGTAQAGSWYFYPLVAVYGIALVWSATRTPSSPAPEVSAQSQRP